MEAVMAGDRNSVVQSAGTSFDGRLFSPCSRSICYCGRLVLDQFLCSECSESMSRALCDALADREVVEVAG